MAGLPLPLIEAVKRQALATFSRKTRCNGKFVFEENLAKLKFLTSKLTTKDVRVDIKTCLGDDVGCFTESKADWMRRDVPPVTYIEVFENSEITIGVFILRNGARLPLHDHPLMHGILKVIYGTVHICSYSPISKVAPDNNCDTRHFSEYVNLPDDCAIPSEEEMSANPQTYRQGSLLAVKEPEMLLTEEDEPCILCPKQGNIHEIHSVSGPAAFLDILAPPYESDIPGVGPRPCQYFKDVTRNKTNTIKTLVRIPNPPDYWSKSFAYLGPPLMPELPY